MKKFLKIAFLIYGFFGLFVLAGYEYHSEEVSKEKIDCVWSVYGIEIVRR